MARGLLIGGPLFLERQLRLSRRRRGTAPAVAGLASPGRRALKPYRDNPEAQRSTRSHEARQVRLGYTAFGVRRLTGELHIVTVPLSLSKKWQ